MDLTVVEETPASLASYGSISIAFAVSSRFRVTPVESGLEGLSLREEPVMPTFVKDYDAHEGEGPLSWRRWDLSNWGILAAYGERRRVGGGVVAWNTDGVHMLEGRADLAVLWDLRVAPDARGCGIGTALFRRAEAWARSRGCRTLKVETQNVNVPACRFYARNGCHLGAVMLHAYPDLPDEVQLLWYKSLLPPGAADAASTVRASEARSRV